MERGAEISNCGKYRYKLWRVWDKTKPLVLWIMHNPSTADGIEDDPTIRRCISFANSWGYGGIYVGNIFPYRSTNPKNLLGKSFDEIAPIENIRHNAEMVKMCSLHIFAFGNPIIKDGAPTFWDNHWMCLKKTKSGNPSHPLYLKSDLKPFPFTI